MIKKLLSRINADVKFELSEANSNYPLFASRHEGLAVIEEEVWETDVALTRVKSIFDALRYNVFTDNHEALLEDVQELRERAVYLACEAVQVAAMCEKWKLGGRYDFIENLGEATMPELIRAKEQIEKEIKNR